MTILQYALTLEHVENAFYSGALKKFDAHAFEQAGFPGWVRGRFAQIGAHEATHVKFLETALGAMAPKACEYELCVPGVWLAAGGGADKTYGCAARTRTRARSRRSRWRTARPGSPASAPGRAGP